MLRGSFRPEVSAPRGVSISAWLGRNRNGLLDSILQAGDHSAERELARLDAQPPFTPRESLVVDRNFPVSEFREIGRIGPRDWAEPRVGTRREARFQAYSLYFPC